jgi:hypothetical protein
MKKLLIFSLICVLSGFVLIACQRDRGVEAGNEQGRTDTYQPRPAPNKGQVTDESNKNLGGSQQEMRGELVRIEMPKKTIVVRTENGLEQTFKWDDSTSIQGLESSSTPNTRTGKQTQATNNPMRSLMGKEGSEVTINWRDDNGAKMATSINVTEVSSKTGTTKNKAKKNTY